MKRIVSLIILLALLPAISRMHAVEPTWSVDFGRCGLESTDSQRLRRCHCTPDPLLPPLRTSLDHVARNVLQPHGRLRLRRIVAETVVDHEQQTAYAILPAQHPREICRRRSAHCLPKNSKIFISACNNCWQGVVFILETGLETTI